MPPRRRSRNLVNPNPSPNPNPNPNPNPIPNQVLAGACEKGVEDACDALTREEEAKAKWLAKQESSSWLAGVSPTHYPPSVP